MPTKQVFKFVLDTVENGNFSADRSLKRTQMTTLEFEEALKFAERNGLYYLFVDNIIQDSIYISHIDREKWEGKVAKIETYKDSIKLVNDICTSGGIDYALIKTFETYPHIPNDIDVFVKKDDRKALIHGLSEHGMTPLYTGITETKLKGNFVDTDIYTDIRYVGIDFIDSDIIWESLTTHASFGIEYPTLNSNADLLMLLPHYVLSHKRMTLLDFLHLRKRIMASNITFCRNHAHEMGWGQMFDQILGLICHLDDQIFRDSHTVEFPYIFSTSLIMDSLSKSKGFDPAFRQKVIIILSFLLQDLMYRSEGTHLYKILSSSPFITKHINNLSSALKVLRGDKKFESI